jgi:hypothetical protein
MHSELDPHPHVPPPVTASHVGPGAQVAWQSTQTAPVLPQLLSACPGMHVPPVTAEQQPLWQGDTALQPGPQTPALHA